MTAFSPCCPEGSLPAANDNVQMKAPEGTIVTTTPPNDQEKPMDIYVTGVADLANASRIVLIFSDVFGYTSGRHRQFADSLAVALGSGTAVVLPDLFRGNPPMQPAKLPFGLLNFTRIGDILGVPGMIYKLKFKYGRDAIIDKAIKRSVFPFLESRGVNLAHVGLSCVGFCYGGWVVTRCLADLENFRCGVGIHPSSFEVETNVHGGSMMDLAKHIGATPLLFLPARNDSGHIKPGGDVTATLAASRGLAETEISVPFPQMTHGWVTRGDRSLETVQRDQDLALDLTVQFIKEHHLQSKF
jgi:dienelactone hydrolase